MASYTSEIFTASKKEIYTVMYGAVSNHSNEKMEIVLQHKVGEDLIESVTVLVAALIQYPIYVNFYPIFLSRWLRTI